ncbi:MAG: T9SS type A sorting domain-containing protein, partial [Bacteroidota bacterium]
ASTTATSASNAGTYPITVAGGSDNNYSLTYSSGTLTIGQLSQTITFVALADVSQTSGTFTLSATASSGLPVTFSSQDVGKVTISGTTVTITGAGSVTITATQAGNVNYKSADAVSRTLCLLPPAPTVTITEDPVLTLNSSANAGNQWFRDGQTIPGAISKTYGVTQSGIYTVKVTIDGCAGPLSQAVNLIITGEPGVLAVGRIGLYPNPAGRELRYVMSEPMADGAQISLVNGNGQTVLREPARQEGVLDLEGLANGVYMFRVTGGSGNGVVRRFIKQ